MVDPNNFFDLYDVLVNEVIGDVWLFVFLMLVLILIIVLRSRMPFQMSAMFSFLWIVIMGAALGLNILYVFAILLIGGFFYYIVSRAIRKG